VLLGHEASTHLFFMLGWARCRFHKKRVRTRYIELVFFAFGGICESRSASSYARSVKCRHTTVMIDWAYADPTKNRPGNHYIEQVFLHSVGSAGHVVGSDTSRVQSNESLIFHDWSGTHKKRIGTHYTKLVLLHLLEYVGHIVHSRMSGARNINALFSCSGGPDAEPRNSTPGYVMPNLCFCSRSNIRII
jgi:hypothetical protein